MESVRKRGSCQAEHGEEILRIEELLCLRQSKYRILELFYPSKSSKIVPSGEQFSEFRAF